MQRTLDAANWMQQTNCFSCARNRAACGAAMPTRSPASRFLRLTSSCIVQSEAAEGDRCLKPGKRHLGRRNVELGFERQPADHGKTTGQIAGDAARAKMHRCTGERDSRKD